MAIYLAYFALGLPSGALGAAWPAIRDEMSLPLEIASIILVIFSIFFVISASLIAKIMRRITAGKITLIGVILLAIGGFVFAVSPAFWIMAVFSAFIGTGMGLIEGALNNYMAEHFSARTMNWMHCFWGVGATLSPLIMSLMITASGWRAGYVTIASIQSGIAIIVLISLLKGLWLKSQSHKEKLPELITENSETPPISEISLQDTSHAANTVQEQSKKSHLLLAKPRNQIAHLAIFFFHSGIDVLIAAYAVSILYLSRGIEPSTASIYIVFYFGALMTGRFLFGIFANKVNPAILIRIGFLFSATGVIIMIFTSDFMAMALIGLGFAPIFPCLIHGTQKRFMPQIVTRITGFSVAAGSAGGAIMSIVAGIVIARINLEAFFPIVLGMVATMFLLNEFLEWRLRAHQKRFIKA